MSSVRGLLVLAMSAAALGATGETGRLEEPLARISLPWANALVRANVPVFGVATAERFKLYRVEFGEGVAPKEWHVIQVSRKPQPVDPWASGKAKWNPNTGARGNLTTWETGLTSYVYGRQQKNLNGVYTLRLVVEDAAGKTAEARVVVNVARAITRETGGIAESCDGKAFLNVAPRSIVSAFLLVSIQPVDPPRNPPPVELKPPRGLVPVGATYEFRPPGLVFMKPAALRLHYDDEALAHTDEKGTRTTLPEGKLGIYAYEPVEETWVRVPGCKVLPGANEVRAELNHVTRYVAFYAVMADLTPPEPPTLEAPTAATERAAVQLSGRGEPRATIEVLAGDKVVASAQADGEGAFQATAVPLTPGQNTLMARAVDGAGNASAPSAAVTVSREAHPPRVVRSVAFVGRPPQVVRGDKVLIKLVGDDADPRVNIATVRVSSETDWKDVAIELTETGPQTGVYVAPLTIGAECDPANNVIAASRHGETITAVAAHDAAKKAALRYEDTVPPTAPHIECPSHPSICQDTFENTGHPLGEWANIDREYGAYLSLETREGKTWLKLTKQQPRGHLGAWARTTPYSAARLPLVAFDYQLYPHVKMDVQVERGGWQLITLNDPTGDHPKWGRRPIGSFDGIVSDGRWHHAELALGPLLAARSPQDKALKVTGIQFINWDKTAYMKTQFGKTGSKGSYWCIDNFRLLGYGGGDARFTWLSEDENGIAGYSVVLDREPDTVPPEENTGMVVEKKAEGLADGRWYLHVRAVDKPGNWGPANHYMIFVDTKAPAAKWAGPEGKVSWETPVKIRLDDHGGSGVNPHSIRLSVGGEVHEVDGRVLSFHPVTQTLTFAPNAHTRRVKRGPRWHDEPLSLIFADGQSVDAELIRAADHAGHPVRDGGRWSYQVTSPLKVTPADPDGKNDWYVTPPKIKMDVPQGAGVKYEWAIAPEQDPLFRRGNSINRLTVTVTEGKGREAKTTRYVKPFKLDTTEPKVTAEVLGPKPGPDGVYAEAPTVVLRHDDYALVAGGLTCVAYAGSDCTGEPVFRRAKVAPGQWELPAEGTRTARSVSWTGRLLAPATGIYKLHLGFGKGQRVQLLINGETVLDSAKAQAGAAEVATEAVLAALAQPVELRWLNPGAKGPGIRLTWRSDGAPNPGPVPASALYHLQSLATIHYRWDGGREKRYEGPIAAPPGLHVLHYRAADEAGHEGEAGMLRIHCAGK